VYVTVMFWCHRFCYRVTVVCVFYCNVLLKYSWIQGFCFLCFTVMCWCSTVGYRVTLVCVCYFKMLVQYFRYSVTFACVLL